MKSFVAILALVAVAAADVSHLLKSPEADAQILKQTADVEPEKYSYSYQTSNGIAGQESGVVNNAGREDAYISVQGAFQYPAPGGDPISLTYTADENGFNAQGAHLPTPPPTQEIPVAIQRALAWIAAHPSAAEKRY